MYATYGMLQRRKGFESLSQEAKDFLKTLDKRLNGPDEPEDPQAVFCDECGAFCGDDYSYDFLEDEHLCPRCREKREYEDEGDYRWYETDTSLWNEEALDWLGTLEFRRTFKADAVTDGKEED